MSAKAKVLLNVAAAIMIPGGLVLVPLYHYVVPWIRRRLKRS